MTRLATVSHVTDRAIIEAAQAFVREAESVVVRGVKLGHMLNERKRDTPHGQWTPWVEENLPFGISFAQKLMKLADNEQVITSNAASVPLLTINDALAVARGKPAPKPQPQPQPKPAPAQPQATLGDLEATLSASAKVRLDKTVEAHKAALDEAHDMVLRTVEKKHKAEIDRLAWERLDAILPGFEERVKKAERWMRKDKPFTQAEFKLLTMATHPDKFGDKKQAAASDLHKRLRDMGDALVTKPRSLPDRMPSLDEIRASHASRIEQKMTKRERHARGLAFDMLRRLYPDFYGDT
ncbi:DUF3102 domain-containing protein [uncultured Shimia sp.]|uniref:DUF3102 domain-containing protein n=1 Tax=uncultured Shimia sp. TaxID=573152 RepID=UPI0026108374|nr:DUF3102 domain-containing protein [uncultured Shimia sp.]